METTAPASLGDDREGFCKSRLAIALRFVEEIERGFQRSRSLGQHQGREDAHVGTILYLTSQIKFLHKVIELDSREIALAHDAIDALKQEINRMDEARERLLEKMGGVDL